MNTEENAKYKENRRRRFLTEPVCKPVMEMSVLTAISRIISEIYNTVDAFFVAHIWTSAAAAVGVCFP